MNERRAVSYDGLDYVPGSRFAVAVEGLKLAGMVTAGRSAWDGWSQDLHLGDILTCTGFGPGWGSDPGYGVEFTTPQSLAAHASHCDIQPHHGGLWAYRPPPGALVAVNDCPGFGGDQ